jgi:hypothetical protein
MGGAIHPAFCDVGFAASSDAQPEPDQGIVSINDLAFERRHSISSKNGGYFRH